MWSLPWVRMSSGRDGQGCEEVAEGAADAGRVLPVRGAVEPVEDLQLGAANAGEDQFLGPPGRVPVVLAPEEPHRRRELVQAAGQVFGEQTLEGGAPDPGRDLQALGDDRLEEL